MPGRRQGPELQRRHRGTHPRKGTMAPSRERITKVQRWLDLIAYLVGRHLPVSVEELMERLPAYQREWLKEDEKARASVRRKFERDKDELRSMGIPLETVIYREGALADKTEGYRIQKKDFYLPYLRLLEEEKGETEEGMTPPVEGQGTRPGMARVREGRKRQAEQSRGEGRMGSADTIELPRDQAAHAVEGLRSLARIPAFPLADAARSALRKITFDLDPHAFGDLPVFFAVPEETAWSRGTLTELSDALTRRKTASFTYHGMQRGEPTHRMVRPYGLLYQHSHWYMVAWDEDREGERLFRVDRMKSLTVNSSSPNTPDFEIPPGPILERYRDREAWELGEPEDAVEARVRFRFPMSLWAERNRYGEKVTEGEDGASIRSFQVRQPNAFLRWVLSLAGEAEIESPEELRRDFRDMVESVTALYRGRER